MNNQKRIALIYLGHRGGGPIFTFKLAESLSKSALTKVFLSSKITNREDWKLKGLDVEFFDIPYNLKSVMNFSWNLSCAKLLCNKIKEFAPQLCLFTMIHPMNFLIQHSLKKSGYKIVSIIHDPKPHSGERIWVKLIQKLELKHPDAFITLSNHSANILKNMVKKPIFQYDHPLMVLEESEEAQHLKQKIISISKEKFVFLNFGRIEPYKGIDILIEAFHRLGENYSNVFLIIAGQGNLSTGTVHRLRNLEDKGQAMFINRFLKDSEIKALIDLSKVVVLPYLDATQSGIVSTVIHYGKPLIVTHVGALLEQTKYGTGALIVPPNDAMNLYRAMEFILKSENVYEIMCEEVKLMKHFAPTWEGFAEEILKIINLLKSNV